MDNFLPNDKRFVLKENEKIEMKVVRFRTLGCYPLTAANEAQQIILTK